MPAQFFDTILATGVRAGQIPARTQSARNWFRKQAQTTTTTAEALIQKEKSRWRSTIKPGKMYLFAYDPKHKKTLPFYDRYPLIFPVDTVLGGFYGINTHYLQFRLRALLMDSLYELVNNKKYDDTTKLKISYQILKKISKYKLVAPCFKKYLSSHVRSRFIEIHPTEWDIALFLDVARFEKQSQKQVWNHSRQLIN